VVSVTADSPATTAATTAATAASTAATAATDTPGAVRYRCAACGNLTRFDVVTTRRTRAFNHYSVGGDLTVEDVEVLAESVEDVTCRWCGNGKAVEVLAVDAEGDPVPDPASDPASDPAGVDPAVVNPA
jgi:DNA-directed RNA polymerase subunit M/transcription elongation factor TFIIS